MEDTPETAKEMEEVEKVLRALKQDAHKRKLQATAREAQRDDDMALREAMAASAGGNSGGSSASTEVMPEMGPAKSQRKEVSLRRVLINGVNLPPSQSLHVSGTTLEVAVQLEVKNLEANETGSRVVEHDNE